MTQKIADDLVRSSPELIDVIMHIIPPKGIQNMVMAAHLRKAIGETSDADD
ncbi:MAG: hypothetical protein H7249_02665 [Chitinophagaceae bacterium]|nr:hypothetical protein [Oligoflexus sp.]